MYTSHIASQFRENGRPKEYIKGQLINVDGDHRLFWIREGYIKRYLISDIGELGVQALYGPGSIFPLTPLFKEMFNQGPPDIYFYEAITKTELLEMDSNTIVAAAAENPILYKDLLFEAWLRLQSNIHHLDNVALKNSLRRVAHELMFLATHFGTITDEGVTIQMPLSHSDLANVLNMTRETVARSFTKLRNRQLIIVHGKSITITNRAGLYNIYSQDAL